MLAYALMQEALLDIVVSLANYFPPAANYFPGLQCTQNGPGTC